MLLRSQLQCHKQNLCVQYPEIVALFCIYPTLFTLIFDIYKEVLNEAPLEAKKQSNTENSRLF